MMLGLLCAFLGFIAGFLCCVSLVSDVEKKSVKDGHTLIDGKIYKLTALDE